MSKRPLQGNGMAAIPKSGMNNNFFTTFPFILLGGGVLCHSLKTSIKRVLLPHLKVSGSCPIKPNYQTQNLDRFFHSPDYPFSFIFGDFQMVKGAIL